MKKKGAKTSIEKALDLIETLKEKEHLGVTELSSILGLNKNNVFRILATLEVKGIVEQDKETEHYKLGMKLLSLEHAYLQNLKFLKKIRPVIRGLRNKIQECSGKSTGGKKIPSGYNSCRKGSKKYQYRFSYRGRLGGC